MPLWPSASARGRGRNAAPRHDAAPCWSAGPVAGQTESLEERLLLFVAAGTKWGNAAFGTSANVTYSFITEDVDNVAEGGTVSNIWEALDLDEQGVRDAVRTAFDRWSLAGGINFTEVDDDGADVGAATTGGDIRIGAHTFSEAGVIAHGFFPPEDGIGLSDSITGDIHFNTAFDYVLGGPGSGGPDDIRFDNTFTHEIGHTIGLGHTDILGMMNIMEAGGTRDRDFDDLGTDDIAGTVFIYGPSLTGGGDVATALFVDVGGGTVIGSRGSLSFEGRDVVGVVPTATGGNDYRIYFDGSDVGLPPGTQINSLAALSNSELLMSFSAPTTIDGFRYEVADIARFTFDQAGTGLILSGENTQGTFDLYFDGSDVGLDGNFSIDGLAINDGDLLMTFAADGGFIGEDALTASDIVRFTGTFGVETSGAFSFEFDGSDVFLDAPTERIDALDGGGSFFRFSTNGNFTVPGLRGNQSDIGVFNLVDLGPDTEGAFDPDLFLDAGVFGFNGLNITGYTTGTFQFPPPPPPTPPRPTPIVPGPGIFPIVPPPQTPISPTTPFGPAGGVNPNFPTYPTGFPNPPSSAPGTPGPTNPVTPIRPRTPVRPVVPPVGPATPVGPQVSPIGPTSPGGGVVGGGFLPAVPSLGPAPVTPPVVPPVTPPPVAPARPTQPRRPVRRPQRRPVRPGQPRRPARPARPRQMTPFARLKARRARIAANRARVAANRARVAANRARLAADVAAPAVTPAAANAVFAADAWQTA